MMQSIIPFQIEAQSIIHDFRLNQYNRNIYATRFRKTKIWITRSAVINEHDLPSSLFLLPSLLLLFLVSFFLLMLKALLGHQLSINTILLRG